MSAVKAGPAARGGGDVNVGGLFDGVGLLAYGLHLAGLEHAWLCEADPWRRSILERRFPGIPVYPDVRAVGHRAPRVDVIAGGFPCKGASTAGKRNGFEHPETVLWREMARAVGELRPRFVLVENVANLLAVRDGAVWGEVVGTLAALGYDTVWDCLPAAAVGAPHLRDRVFAVATDTDRERVEPRPRLRAGAPEGRRRSDPHDAAGEDPAAPNPDGDPGRDEPEPEPKRRDPAATRTARQAAADADEGGGSGRAQPDRPSASGGQPVQARDDAHGPGVPVGVEWGSTEPAIQRWEQVTGTAPEPLLRGVDARSARRVVRSRLSALGDGVQVQVGFIVGRYIVSRAGELS